MALKLHPSQIYSRGEERSGFFQHSCVLTVQPTEGSKYLQSPPLIHISYSHNDLNVLILDYRCLETLADH